MRSGLFIVSVLLLGVSWLALDDITTGSEPSHLLEWTMVAATAIWFAVLAIRRLRAV